MKVKKVMTADAGFCSPEEPVSKAVEVMWEKDCGAVPVLDAGRKPVGIITDRDIAVAAASRDERPSQISIAEVIGDRRVAVCRESDDAEDALKKMRRAKVRRLPVVDDGGALAGIVSITDLLLKAPKLKKKVHSALKAIGRPRPIVLSAVAEEEERAPGAEL